MEKIQAFHYSVTELGNLQLRIVEKCIDGDEITDIKYSLPMTPADTSDMTDWDSRSRDIVEAITDSTVLTDFTLERLANGYDALEQYKKGMAELIDYDRVIETDGRIAVRRITRIFEDGKKVSKKYHRSWIMPGQETIGSDVMSKAIADKIHTPEVIAAYKEAISQIE